MANIRPFRAIRTSRDKASLLATRSYLTYSKKTIDEKLKNNPYTFLHIIKPSVKNDQTNLKVDKYKIIKNKFTFFLKSGILKKDKIRGYYIYQKYDNQNKFTGIIAATSIEEYLNNNIKKHEKTLDKREKMFSEYLDQVGFNADPVLLTHKPIKEINKFISKFIKKRSEYEFTTTDKCLHKLWIVNKKNDIELITKYYKKIKNLYIADGHHRCASSALLSKKRNCLKSKYFMSYLIDENQLKILSFNRMIKNLNGYTSKEFLEKLKKRFNVVNIQDKIYIPNKKNEISMYINKKWYSLILKKQKNSKFSSDELGPSILSNNIFEPILNIKNERTSKNIAFYQGGISLSKIIEEVNNNIYDVAFILQPLSIDAIKKISDNNETLPPKSTYIEPKLRSGLTIYPINNEY